MCEFQKVTWLLLVAVLGIFQSTQSATLRFYLYKGSLDSYYEVPLNNSVPALDSTFVDKTLPTVIYAFGYIQLPNDTDVETVMTAYMDNINKNIVMLNWEEEASDGGLGEGPGYAGYAVPNAKTIGNELGNTITSLIAAGLNSDVHCIGHSLGAQLVGYTGAQATANGQALPCVTGLDPAGPGFDTAAPADRLDPTDAQFVDVIHTNPVKYGANVTMGTVDIWFNFNYTDGLQPGCPVGSFPAFSTEDLCSHQRSVYYFSEALGSPDAFEAAGATDYASWVADDTTGVTLYVGEETNKQASGNFYLTTNAAPPYGKGEDGTEPDSEAPLTSDIDEILQ